MGTSTCHIVLSDTAPVIPGACGVVRDGVIPGLFGYEAGQSAVGDIFALVRGTVRPAGLSRPGPRARRERPPDPRGRGGRASARASPGLLALDWWNGNRSVLVDADLSGLMVGMTLATTAPEMYRALIEATAFGTRAIIDAFEDGGVRIDRVVACGGLPERNRTLMQIYADVTGRSFRVAASAQTPALGSAMFAAVAAGPAAGGYATIEAAAEKMAHLREGAYEPIEANRQVYETLFAEYVRLHDLFGRGGDPAMKTLKRLRLQAAER